MYLAIKEILHNKLRYSLVLVTVFLISFMVFFMTSLAIGLVRDNRTAADNWESTGVVLSKYANKNLTASFITEDNYKDKLSDDAAPLGYMFAVTNLKNDDTTVNISIFAQNWDSFIAPELIEGHYPESKNEVIIDQSMENYNIKMGDQIQLNGSTDEYKVVGITNDSKFFTVPVIYTDLSTYWKLQHTDKTTKTISAIVLNNDVDVSGEGLVQVTEQDMISNIPGYTPEVNVFMGMIIALVVITCLVVGIFIYIIMIQKLGLYGIMRAQGIQSKTIIWSLFCQIFVLSGMGVLMALIGVWAVKFVLPATLFFYPSWLAYSLLSLAIIIMALLGGLISLPKILKIDPIEAIGE
ncbi:ABC transporter permease [Enterococcus faecalis]|uniref:ABC transporter permease n=1 Tax=Enterococcus faecalis TaxID=1351 RepID=UPI0003548EA0|nr:ABC transporter permease [Enterococcus faecalis]EGO6635369.1 ABC transporter permease [Enterococcus faecalis]EGO8155177.1 ABC transporter permease [Enterococcus faecalis]EGO9141506.1 ABC transporter permease [Enterococcus faecalis]EPH69373.1 efflux ABC transporter, permease protein [Enterococcus faecalis 20-SD-BW-06]EPI00711.1 efflux ABC transporter, permease protein [Enterococcus faecalis 20-SD-BW-08]